MNSNARLLIKSSVKFAHQAGYYLLQGRWHKLQTGKPAPKGAPIAHVPHAAGQHLPATLTPEEVEQLKYPSEKAAANKEMAAFNEKHLPEVLGHAANGDATAILGMAYGTNTFAKKKALIANHLLSKMGSPHKVAPGQKAGEHAAVKAGPVAPAPAKPAVEPAGEADASTAPVSSPTKPKKEFTYSVKPADGGGFYIASDNGGGTVLAHKPTNFGILDNTPAKNFKTEAAALAYMQKKGMKQADAAPTEAGHAEGDKWVMPLDAAIAEHKELVHTAETPSKADDKAQLAEQKEELGKMEAAKDGASKRATGTAPGKSALEHVIQSIERIASKPPANVLQAMSTEAGKWLSANPGQWDELNSALLDQGFGAIASFGKHSPQNKAAGPKDGDTKQGAGGQQLVFKDGRWHKVVAADEHGELPPVLVPVADAPGGLTMPAFTGGSVGQSVIDYYEKQAKKVMDLAAAGNLLELQQMAYNGLKPNAKGKVSNTWAGKTPNSKLFLALHAQALEQAKGGAKPSANQEPVKNGTPAPAPVSEPSVAPEAPPIKKPPRLVIPKTTPQTAANANLAQIPWDTFKVPEANSNAKSHNPAVDKIKAMAEAGDVAGLEAFHEKKAASKQTYAQKQAKLAKLAILALQEPAAAPAPAAPAAPSVAAPAGSLLDKINFEASLLPASNSNAKSHNGAVEKIKAMALAGDVAGLQSFVDAKAGAKQTYAKKQHLLASTALAALKEGALASPAPATLDPDVKEGVDTLAEHFSGGGEQGLHHILQSNAPGTPIHEYAKQKIAEATAKLNAGPQEGDTKVVDGVTYVLKNGRWHKQGGDLDETKAFQLKTWIKMGKPTKGSINADMQATWDSLSPSKQFELEKEVDKEAVAAAPSSPAIPAPPQFSSVGGSTVWADRYAKVAQALHEKVLAEGAAAFKGVVVSHADGRFSVTLANFKLQKFGPTDKQEYRQQMHAYVTALKAAVGKAPKAPKQKAAPASAPAAAPSPAAPLIESMDSWSQTGPQGGSNPGGRFKDAAGVEWYCKFPADDDVAKSEVLAAKLYSALGIAAQDAKLVTKGGKIGIASRWVDVKKGSAATLAKTDGVRMGFAADAWLANWDVVGMAYDNLQIGADGKAVRVDAGGSLEYRAQGGKKAFGNFVTEIDSLRDPKINPQAAAVFGGMTDADITASVAKVLQISDAQIRAMVAEFGPGDAAAKKALADTLIARKEDLASKYPKAVKTPAKKVLDPAALPVNPDQLPKRHDFANWNGPGNGLSSKEHVNNANSDVEDQLYALGKAGNLTALKNFHFQPVDKETGAPSGHPVPIAKHPSKHVVQLHDDIVQMLEEIANPPEPLKVFRETDVNTIDGLAAAFPPKPFGTTASKVSSNEKLGFWVALGAVKGAAKKFAPPSPLNFTQQAISAAYDKFKAASALAKHFVHSVQASGSYNDLFRNGAEKDHSGNKLSDVAKAALELATEQPEGTTVYRWQNMSDDMVKKVLAAQEGTVFQATGPMCTSYAPTATKHFGPHRVVFRYAKGAKAVESFGSGGFKSEKEITTLPNSRFVILSKKMVPDTEHGNPGKQRLELEVLMLPPDLGIQ